MRNPGLLPGGVDGGEASQRGGFQDGRCVGGKLIRRALSNIDVGVARQQVHLLGMLELQVILEAARALLDADILPAEGAARSSLLVGVILGVVSHEVYPEARFDVHGLDEVEFLRLGEGEGEGGRGSANDALLGRGRSIFEVDGLVLGRDRGGSFFRWNWKSKGTIGLQLLLDWWHRHWYPFLFGVGARTEDDSITSAVA
mmetsp:Transcript_31727/g.76849  ORF Transcript_31727/g.76849 Transcript_31727/m.76849 type:complete len:200 (-) Transcript_31727:44-643(-)